MNWSGGSVFDHTGSDDDDDDGDDPYQRPYTGGTQHTLSQSLLSIAQRWESDKERELSSQRRLLAEANANLRAERTKNLQAQNTIGTLKTEHERALSAAQQELKLEKDRVRELTEANKMARTHAFGSWLLLAELRAAALAHLPVPAPAKALEAAPPAASDGDDIDDADDAGDADDADDAEGGEDGGEDGGADGKLTKAQKKKLKEKRQKERKKAAAASSEQQQQPTTFVAADPEAADAAEEGAEETPLATRLQPKEADAEGAAAASDTPATAQLRSLVTELPALAGTEELLGACRDGRTRLVTEGLEAPPPLLDALRARAEAFLARGLAHSAASGNVKLCKLLLEAGASVERAEALHAAVRGGHTALLAHLATLEHVSVNSRDASGASPLHVAAECNQPKAAQFLMRHCAFVDALDASGRSALQIANERRWREMQRVLQDHSLLFWNRAARANKLYKANDYEAACDSYAAAAAELQAMTHQVPSGDTLASFHFNHGRSCQALGRLVQAASLFTATLDQCGGTHQRALEQRAECHASLLDLDAAIADWEALSRASSGADAAAKKAATRRIVEARATLAQSPRQVLGLDAAASDAEVRKAYRQLCLAHHPDKHAASTPEAQTRAKFRFERIQAAYAKLTAAPPSPYARYSYGGF